MVLVHDRLRSGAFLQRAQRDGGPVLVTSTNEEHLLPPGAQVPHVDVRRQVGPGDMADVERTVGVGQRGGDGGACWFFHGKGPGQWAGSRENRRAGPWARKNSDGPTQRLPRWTKRTVPLACCAYSKARSTGSLHIAEPSSRGEEPTFRTRRLLCSCRTLAAHTQPSSVILGCASKVLSEAGLEEVDQAYVQGQTLVLDRTLVLPAAFDDPQT